MKTRWAVLAAGVALLALHGQAAERTLLLIAGRPSHPPGMHEFRAGALLLQKCLAEVPGLKTLVASNGWPTEAGWLERADAIVIYADGGGGHPAIQQDRLKLLQGLLDKGVGFGVMHYACEVPKDRGGKEFLEWVGGYYEDRYSCNPIWEPEFKRFVNHPTTRGVQPFSIKDEWYFCLRFRENMEGIIPILAATPSDKVRNGPYVWPAGPYPHVQAASGREEVMMWAVERPNGGRSFGFTGGHFHANWGEPNFRKVVLNALLWVSKVDVPPQGVASTVTAEELQQNLDPKGKK
ncbi:MAG: ThuA domain-containing protein [Verrucomicrobiae bacterium]|nr:ThuA domain-containing protein [Verrucomicrobiae bacterium]